MGKRKSVQYNIYKPEDLIKYMKKGFWNCQIIDAFDISEVTFYNWLKIHPEFKEAYEMGIPKRKAYYAGKFHEILEGKNDSKHAFKAAEAILTKELKEWTENSVDTTVNLNVHLTKSTTEILEYLKQQAQAIDIDVIEIKEKVPNGQQIRLIEPPKQEPEGTS